MAGQSAVGTIKNATSGWTFTGTVESDRGYVLSDLAHDNNDFAVEIALERIGVAGFSPGSPYRSSDDPATYRLFKLGDATQTAKPTITELSTSFGETVPLGYYKPNLKVSTSYTINDVFETGQTLELDQTFLFTPYNKDPSHEPTGIIPATRVYPLLRFKTPGPVNKRPVETYRRITAVQAIYRLHINLTNEGLFNQAGIFRDYDSAGTGVGIVRGLMTGGPSPATQAFSKAEKPLMYEVSGLGIDRGNPGEWDNIHQWSVDSTPLDDPNKRFYVATPGLPYGAHMHWRWGETAATGALAFSGGPQFGGITGPGSALVDPGPALVDPNVGDQSIEFAINQGGKAGQKLEAAALRKLDNDPILYLFKSFDQLWAAATQTPEVMLPARDLVIWLSITAYSSTYLMPQLNYHDFPTANHDLNYALPDWAGTLFAHGMFFAHEDITILPKKLRLLPGLTTPQYLPSGYTPKQTWRR
jgi:hypothetical protein